MFWYEAPIWSEPIDPTDPAQGRTRTPGHDAGDGVGRRVVPGMVMPAYGPTTCLVGCPSEVTLPDWTPLDLAGARAFFTGVYGREPGPREVYETAPQLGAVPELQPFDPSVPRFIGTGTSEVG